GGRRRDVELHRCEPTFAGLPRGPGGAQRGPGGAQRCPDDPSVPARRPGPSVNGFPGPGSPLAMAASIRPISGTNLKPCPEKPAPATIEPARSSTKSSVGVDV